MHSILVDGPGYRCRWDSCTSKDKIWPRADNFRRHLNRIHNVSVISDDELKAYRKRTLSVLLA
jgi:ferredoxin-fold anticodon binding domain-containing protein